MNLNVAVQQTGYLLAHPDELNHSQYQLCLSELDYPETSYLNENFNFINQIALIDKIQMFLEHRDLPYQICSALDSNSWALIKNGAGAQGIDYLIPSESIAKICAVTAKIFGCKETEGMVSAVLITHMIVETSLKEGDDYKRDATAGANIMHQLIAQRRISIQGSALPPDMMIPASCRRALKDRPSIVEIGRQLIGDQDETSDKQRAKLQDLQDQVEALQRQVALALQMKGTVNLFF